MLMMQTNEEARLDALRQFEILDTPPQEVFDELVRAAATLCKTPVALLELVDQDRSWFKAKMGVDIAELPRDHSFAAQAMLEDDVLIVPDATADERFAAWLPVIGEQPIRFYAGMPLVTRSGYAIGTLSVVDFAPRELTRQQTEWLRILSKQAVHELEGRLNGADLTQVVKELDEQASAIRAAEAALRQRVSDLHQRRTRLEELEAERAGLLTRALQQLRVELAERILMEVVLKQREEELCQLRARLDELTTERTSEVVRVTEQVEQEMAARQRAEQTLLQREGEWENHRTHLEGVIAEQTSEMTRVKEQLQGQRDELAQLNEALLNRGEQLGKVEQGLHDLVQGIRQELERYAHT